MPGPLSVVAQSAPQPLPRLSGPIELDGYIDEPAWEAIDPLPLTTYQPTYRGPITERTEIRIAYDDTHLYVAGRLYDANPDGIRANSLYRDRYSGDDTFAVIIDTFNDNETALWFYTTPLGMRADMAVSNDGESGAGATDGPINDNWNTYWSSEARVTEDGWFAEIRIPFSSLGFQSDGERVVMGLSTYRFIARKNERYVYPDIPPNWSRGFAKPSQMQDVVLTGISTTNPIYVQPYVLGGLDQASTLEASEAAYEWDRSTRQEVGFDAKYNLTGNLTLDVTVNTDFAQVEADEQQVNLTRFSLFFPEKRQFFQERASVFAFGTGGNDRLFFSRRIGLVSGEPVRIWGGTRLVGRIGTWDVGVLDMQTARDEQLGVPSENFGVARVRRRVLNENSYAGAILTSRIGMDGTYNVAYGLDALVRVAADEYLTLKWAQTFDHVVIDRNENGLWASSLVRGVWSRRRLEGWNYGAAVTRSGPVYQPDLGFVTRRDFTQGELDVGYGWFPGTSSRFANAATEVAGIIAVRNPDGTVESAAVEHEWSAELKSGHGFAVGGSVRYEDLRFVLPLPESSQVPAGSYTFGAAALSYEAPNGHLFRPEFDLDGGTFYDGRRIGLSAAQTWNASRHLELEGRYLIDAVRFPDRDQSFVTHIGRVRAQVALDTRFSTAFFVQYSSAAELALTNIRLRYNFGEGNDVWLVYNEGFNTDRYRTTPALPTTDARTILLKLTYTFDV